MSNKHIQELEFVRSRLRDTAGVIAGIKPRLDDLIIESAAGEKSAIKEMDTLRRAEQEHADLLLAEPLVVKKVQDDEHAVQLEIDQRNRETIQRARITVAAEIDRLGGALLAELNEFDRLGGARELSQASNGGMTAFIEQRGDMRVLSALRPLIRKLQPNAVLPDKQTKLEDSERILWHPNAA
jgi:hypothetical protein